MKAIAHLRLTALALSMGVGAPATAEPGTATPKLDPLCAVSGAARRDGLPLLEGLTGFVIADPPPMSGPGRAPRMPMRGWRLRGLVQTGPKNWRPQGPYVAHKTPARVLAARIRTGFRGSVEGLLDVELTRTRGRATIDVNNFAIRPYWACPLRDHPSDRSFWDNTGSLLAVLRQGAKAVNQQGNWVALKAGEHVLCSARFLRRDKVLACLRIDRNGQEREHLDASADDLVVTY